MVTKMPKLNLWGEDGDETLDSDTKSPAKKGTPPKVELVKVAEKPKNKKLSEKITFDNKLI